jgi:DNA-binding NtrC family response regulator
MPLSIQAKLLRVIETRTVLRVGGLTPRRIDVRFIAATNRDLEAEVARGRFRADLCFRIDGVTLVVPPLRERVCEIAELARTFAAEASRRIDGVEVVIDHDAIGLLEGYRWPGNIRELRNVIERAVLLAHDGRIGLHELPVVKLQSAAPPDPAATRQSTEGDELPQLRRRVAELERARILSALDRCGGNQTRAAKLLAMPRRTLVSRLAKYDVPRPRKP